MSLAIQNLTDLMRATFEAQGIDPDELFAGLESQSSDDAPSQIVSDTSMEHSSCGDLTDE
jgi:hypothetical protein